MISPGEQPPPGSRRRRLNGPRPADAAGRTTATRARTSRPRTTAATQLTVPVTAAAEVEAPPVPAPIVHRVVREPRGRRPRHILDSLVRNPRLTAAGALALVTAAAVYVRFVGLSQVGFNSDEAVYSGQAAAIAGFQPYGQLFGVFRAHPLLVQFIVAVPYTLSGHVNDLYPRAITSSFGVALAIVCWGIGTVVRGRFFGFAMGMIAALCPYAVLVSRQMLLDGPMTTFVAATMLMIAIWLRTRQPGWFYAAAAMAALAVLAKEMGMLTVPAVVIFLMFSRDLPMKWKRDMPIAVAVFAVAISPYPLSLILGGGTHATNQFVLWQFFRQPNHDAGFYLAMVPPSLGYVTLALAALGLASLRWRWQNFDTLAVSLIVCNVAFFEIWPTKGFEYLMPIVPAVVYMAGRGAVALSELGPSLARMLRVDRLELRWAASFALAMALVSMAPPIVDAAVDPRNQGASAAVATDSDVVPTGTAVKTFVAGTGGLEASRPSGDWVRTHTLPSAQFLTIGPSFANVVQFYGQRKAFALSVSPNPLHRNPQYEPVNNPDAAIRSGSIQYLIYDAYSASRSPYFAKSLMTYVNKFRGVAVYTFRSDGPGGPADVVIYEVHP